MVHLFKFVRGVGETEKQLEEKVLSGLEKAVREYQLKQKKKIEEKLSKGKKLTEFEKWFMKQPEYEELKVS